MKAGSVKAENSYIERAVCSRDTSSPSMFSCGGMA